MRQSRIRSDIKRVSDLKQRRRLNAISQSTKLEKKVVYRVILTGYLIQNKGVFCLIYSVSN